MSNDQTFQVDLRGVVDLLSRHLYSSPRVYLRELLQNAVDASTARGNDGEVRIETAESTGDGSLRVHDNGIGLSEQDVRTLLATIGRTSKRDPLGFTRDDFLGQFGIGLLSGFLIADEITVETRSANGEPTVTWCGFADGSYRVELAGHQRPEPGTTVTLRPRPGSTDWTSRQVVVDLARSYGSLLPVRLFVDDQPITVGGPPWLCAYGSPGRRDDALREYCREVFGFTPLDVIELDVPEAGLTGLAYILPSAANPTARSAHRVYLKRMLLTENTADLLPDWAFFARCVVDATELRPTASREALYEDDLLEHTRDALGDRIRQWLRDIGETEPQRLRTFLDLHHLGVKALALHDDEMLRIVDDWLAFETSAGPSTLARFRRGHATIAYTPSVDEFRRLSAVAEAQGIGLINAGYVYETEIIERLPAINPDARIERIDPAMLATQFAVLDPETELGLRVFLRHAENALAELGAEVIVRDFHPASLPALYLTSRAAEHHAQWRDARDHSDEHWSGVLGALQRQVATDRPQLVLNHRNPLARRVSRLREPELITLAVEALYGQALLHGRHPLRPADSAALNRSALGLLDWAVTNTTGDTDG